MTRAGSPAREFDYDHWLQVCRQYVCGYGHTVKVAELGGDGNDTSFEQAMSNLGHAYLRDRAPGLLDHELGFQLIDRNQENTKAVGVFAFKVGSQDLFAPVFFLKGELKGHELLYLRQQDLFVPLKENWLNYIMNRKPNILGSGVSRQTSTMGVRQPDLNRLTRSPHKYASAMIPSVRPFLPVYAHLTSGSLQDALDDFTSHAHDRLDLGHFFKQASVQVLRAAVDLFQQKPHIAAAFDSWYGMETLRTAVKEAQARLSISSVLDSPTVNRNRIMPPVTGSVLDLVEKSAADGDKGPDVKQKIRIITWDASWVAPPDGLTEEDQERLLKETVLIEDRRSGDEVSVPLNIQVKNRLSNPPETGIYQVLTKLGEFEKCLVVCDPHGPEGRSSIVTVVRLDEGTRNWGNFKRHDVWVAGTAEKSIPGGEESWDDWFQELASGSLSVTNQSRFMLIGPRRNATCPFRVEKEIGSSHGTESYEVDFSDTCPGQEIALGLNSTRRATYPEFDTYDRWRDGQRIHLDAKGGTDLRSSRGDVYIPKGYKVLRVEPACEDKERDDDDRPISSCCGYGDRQSDTPPIMPGKLADATLLLMNKTASLKINCDGSRYSINNGKNLATVPALICLVQDHGFREDTGRELLKQARDRAVRLAGPFSCRVKYASPYLTDGGPAGPSIPDTTNGDYNPIGWRGPVMNEHRESLPVPDLAGAMTDPQIYNVNPDNQQEPMDSYGVSQAIQTGQKEIFDTSTIGSLLKAVRDDTLIDRYLPDLVKGMDRVGRILFMFYWRQDQFADRYGKQELPELEDSLRNTFESIGELVLFLKQKSIDPYPEENISDVNLQPIAGA